MLKLRSIDDLFLGLRERQLLSEYRRWIQRSRNRSDVPRLEIVLNETEPEKKYVLAVSNSRSRSGVSRRIAGHSRSRGDTQVVTTVSLLDCRRRSCFRILHLEKANTPWSESLELQYCLTV